MYCKAASDYVPCLTHITFFATITNDNVYHISRQVWCINSPRTCTISLAVDFLVITEIQVILKNSYDSITNYLVKRAGSSSGYLSTKYEIALLPFSVEMLMYIGRIYLLRQKWYHQELYLFVFCGESPKCFDRVFHFLQKGREYCPKSLQDFLLDMNGMLIWA